MRKIFNVVLLVSQLLGGSLVWIDSYARASEKPVVLAVGDSLTEGYGVSKKDAYPAVLEGLLKDQGQDVKVINAGTSGATTAFGIRTIRFQLRHHSPILIIYALGANDGLRAIKPDETKENIEEAIQLAQKAGIPLLLAGMQAPPNYGVAFTEEFKKVYPDLAKKYGLPMIPFLLDGVAGEPPMNQADGIHPNEQGYQIIARNVANYVLPLLSEKEKK